MAGHASIELRVRVAWWLGPYLSALAFFCVITRAEPDWSKLERTILRAVRCEVA